MAIHDDSHHINQVGHSAMGAADRSPQRSAGGALTAKLRAVFLALLGCLVVMLAIGAVDRWIVEPAFARLQRAQAMEDLQRAEAAINSELHQLGRTLTDWSNWDDTYRFVADRNPAFVEDNFRDWSMLEKGTKINLCLVLSARGAIVYGGGYVSEHGGDLIPRRFAGDQAPGIARLRPVWAEGQSVEGLLNTEAGLYLVSAGPILTTQGSGPSRGALLMGRWLSPALLLELAEQVQVAFTLFVRDDPRLSPQERALWRQLAPGQPWIDPDSPDPAFVYQVLANLDGEPAFLLRTPIRDDIALVARQTSHALVGTLGLSSIALFLAMAWISRRDPRGSAGTSAASAWGGATLVVVVGLALTLGAFAELRLLSARPVDASWILFAGSLLTVLCALYLYSLLARQAGAEVVIARRTAEVAESEARLRGILGHAPIGIGVFELGAEDALILVAANASVDEILQRPCSRQLGVTLETLLPALAGTERPRIYRQLARHGGTHHWDEASYRDDLVARDYEITAFQSAPDTVTVMLADVTERRRAQFALEQRDRLLQAAAAALAELLTESAFDVAIQSALGILGRAVGADRAYVYQNIEHSQPGRHRARWLAAWRATQVMPHEPDPALRTLDYEPVFPGWWERLAAGDSIAANLGEFPASAGAFLAGQAIKSLLILPVLVQGGFWGVIGFADRSGGRAWTATEDSLLRAVAAAIGHAYVRHQAEARQRLASAVFESVSESIVVTDAQRRILAVNRAFTVMTGYEEAEVLGRDPRLLKSGRHPDVFYRALWECLASEGHWQGELINRCKDGSLSVVLSAITEVRDAAGHLTHYVGTSHDISHQKEAERRIEQLANFDPLTDLPNRSLLTQRADLALSLATRSGRSVALLFMDLDAFKDVNDSLGHGAGDQILVEAARRLSGFMRGSDTLCRLGGDEFVLLLPDTEQRGAEEVANKILQTFRAPFMLAAHRLSVTLSIGVALAPRDGAAISELLKNADTALYQAKGSGRNMAVFFDRDMNRAAVERLTLSTELRAALATGQLRAHYQPKVDLVDGRLLAAEALVRWEHPSRGLLPPGVFIPVAESSGLIVEIGDWMLSEVCRQLAAWRQAGYPPVRVAVNLAARHFRSPGLAARVADLLSAHALSAQWLALELTESTLLDSGSTTVETLRSLRALGVELAIDDFGTGYSSLSYLRDLPIDALKIDRSFVKDLKDRADDRVFVSTIIALGHALGLVVIAEGVETEDQRAILREQGCDQAQGFFFARPESPERFAKGWLRDADPVV